MDKEYYQVLINYHNWNKIKSNNNSSLFDKDYIPLEKEYSEEENVTVEEENVTVKEKIVIFDKKPIEPNENTKECIYNYPYKNNDKLDLCKNDIRIIIDKFITSHVESITNSNLKPEIFDTKINNDLLHTILNKTRKSKILDEIIIDNFDNSNRDIFNEKKSLFYDLITDLVSFQSIFINQEIIFNFQYLVNKLIKESIIKYLINNGYDNSLVSFIYKGGTAMKIIYDKYKELFNKNGYNTYEKFFSRSDSDYQIIINADNQKLYYKIYYDINILIYNCINNLLLFLNTDNNIDCICPINNITPLLLKTKLEEINCKLNLNKKENKIKNYDFIKEIIGITFCNQTYFEKNIPGDLSYSSFHKFPDNIKNSNNDDEFIANKEILCNNKQNFYITASVNKQNNKYYSKISFFDNKNNKGLYYYINETNHFRYNNKNEPTSFLLHRVKINCVLYYVTNNNKYGYINSPGELIDISIPRFNDYKKFTGYNLKSIYYKNYKIKKGDTELVYKSYTLFGFIHDIFLSFFEETYFWNIKKYDKKINRIFFLLFIYLNNKYINNNEFLKLFNIYTSNYTNTQENYNKIINFNFINKKAALPSDNKTLEEIKKIFTFIHDNTYNKLISEPDKSTYIYKVLKIINDMIIKFELVDYDSDSDNEIEDIPSLKKYLKYKQKYMELKNK